VVNSGCEFSLLVTFNVSNVCNMYSERTKDTTIDDITAPLTSTGTFTILIMTSNYIAKDVMDSKLGGTIERNAGL